ncbi:MAG: PAS domain S-box protein [Pseudomonadota bacterium]
MTRRSGWLTAAAGAVVVVSALVYYLADAYVVAQVEKRVRDTMLECRAFHLYVQRDMHPAYYGLIKDGRLPEDFYAPELLSSSYITRTFQNYYNEERRKAGLAEVRYKMAAGDPRNPVNQADAREKELITWFNEDKTRSHYREIVKKDGKKYLLYARPFLPIEQRCLKCHGTPEDAPAKLRDTYHWSGGWNHKVGDIVAAEFILSPLQGEYNVVTTVIGGFGLVLGLGLMLLVLNGRLQVLVMRRTQNLQESQRRLKRLNRLLTAIRNINGLITQEKDRNRLLEETCRLLVETRGFYAAYVVPTVDGKPVAPFIHAGIGGGFETMADRLLAGELPNCARRVLDVTVAKEVADLTAQCGDCPLAAIHPGKARLATRLEHEGSVFGWLTVSVSREEAIDTVELALFAEMANDVAFALWTLDIEARQRRGVEALRESEEKFRLTFNSSPDAININRLQDGIYVDINDGFTGLTGFTAEDVAGKTALDINIWHDPADRVKMIQVLRENGVCDNLEARFRRKDGSVTTALMSARVISLKGEPHIISMTRDISERKQAEAERERLLMAIEQANELVAITDASGTIQYVNPAFEIITGYSSREAVGGTPRVLKSGRHDRAFYKALWDTISSGTPWSGRLINRRKNGALYTGESSISPVKDENGSVVNFVWISRDITNELELEKRVFQAQKLEAIGALAGGIAHDFNNILYPIIGFSEILMEDLPAGSPEHENVAVIFKAAMRAGELVKQILSFSRQARHEKLPVRIQHILQEVLKLTRSTIPSGIDITHSLQSDCGLIMADPTQLHQIAMNLITNAYHAVEEAGSSISIQLKESVLTGRDWAGISLEPGRYALLTVTDNGCGIDPANMGRIFEPFFTTKEQGKGTGLGLSVVYGIVKEHGGDIRVYSELGKGTTFTVYLPIIKADPKIVPIGELVIYETGTERILLVDDEEPIVRIEKQMLERLGYHVEDCTGSMEALKVFRGEPNAFDLVITDMNMPNMAGDKLATELRSVRPDIPIIICTGFSVKIDEQKAKAIGVNGCLMKPVVKSEMAKMVRNVLDEAKLSTHE